MRENLDTSINIALKMKSWATAFNHLCVKLLKEHPELSDELQIFLIEVGNVTFQAEERACQVIATLNERQQIFGSTGLEKSIKYLEEADE